MSRAESVVDFASEGQAVDITSSEYQSEGEGLEEEELVEEEEEDVTLINKLVLLHPDVENPYRELDETRYLIRKQWKEKVANAPPTLLDKAESKKGAIERQLEQSSKKLADLLAFGYELITNIRVSTEKNEVARKQLERTQKSDLVARMKYESVESLAVFNDIQSRWSELETLEDPVEVTKQLNEQKERYAELLQEKDRILEICQVEIDRMNEKYYTDQHNNERDIVLFVERIDAQIKINKYTFEQQLKMLERSIENERQSIGAVAQQKWVEFFGAMKENEMKKLDIVKEKLKFYNQEVEKICANQEEITRATRIRLEKQADALTLELRQNRNRMLFNSEKLDYNYQILQKRNVENIIINNQQKHRLAKLIENISALKKKIQAQKIRTDATIRKITDNIKKQHLTIRESEKKLLQFQITNKSKFDRVWNINFKEVTELLLKVLEIDRIMHEQQLAVPWKKPSNIDLKDINEPLKKKGSTLQSKVKYGAKFGKESKQQTIKEKRAQIQFLRSILKNISDRTGFLLESKLLELLKPFSETENCLVRIENIFSALQIRDIKIVTSLTSYFKPYSWCPNCMKGVSPEALKKVYTMHQSTTNSRKDGAGKLLPVEPTGPNDSNAEKECSDHYYVVEPELVLTALNTFTNNEIKDTMSVKPGEEFDESNINLISLDKETIEKFWLKFPTYLPKEKHNLWRVLEHGLNHYLEILKEREHLYNEWLLQQKRSRELKYLLRRFTG